jgi:hypothetical protein
MLRYMPRVSDDITGRTVHGVEIYGGELMAVCERCGVLEFTKEEHEPTRVRYLCDQCDCPCRSESDSGVECAAMQMALVRNPRRILTPTEEEVDHQSRTQKIDAQDLVSQPR